MLLDSFLSDMLLKPESRPVSRLPSQRLFSPENFTNEILEHVRNAVELIAELQHDVGLLRGQADPNVLPKA